MSESTSPTWDMLWVDVETTGLELDDPIIEIGLRLGTSMGDLGPSFQSLVWHPGWLNKLEREGNEIANDMHEASGLKRELIQLTMDLDKRGHMTARDIDKRIMDWLAHNQVPVGELPMCGSSIHFDRYRIAQQMPDTDSQFSYRNIDISTVKELCRRLNPEVYKAREGIQNDKSHRVLSDIEDTVREYMFYQEEFFLW